MVINRRGEVLRARRMKMHTRKNIRLKEYNSIVKYVDENPFRDKYNW